MTTQPYSICVLRRTKAVIVNNPPEFGENLPVVKSSNLQNRLAMMAAKLEFLEKSQHKAANDASSEAAARRYCELAKALAAALEYVKRLRVASL